MLRSSTLALVCLSLLASPVFAQSVREDLSKAFEDAGAQFSKEIDKLVRESQAPFVDSLAKLFEKHTAGLRAEITAKDARIAELEAELARVRAGNGAAEKPTEPKSQGAAFLGVGHIANDAGAYVTSVVPGSPAASAGIRDGDIIVEVDGKKATSENLGGLIGALSVGTKARVKLSRDGKSRDVEVALVDRQAFLKSLEEAGDEKPETGDESPSVTLGVTVEEDADGVFAYEVEKGWTGDVAGIEKGDRITHVQGVAVKTVDEIAAAVRAVKAGTELSLRTRRGDEVIEIRVVGSATGKGAKLVAREVAKKESPRSPPFLGVGLVPAEGGLSVTQLVPDSCAAAHGVQVGDLLVAVAGKPTTSIEELQAALEGLFAGDSTTLSVRRGGENKDLKVKLGARGEKVTPPEGAKDAPTEPKKSDPPKATGKPGTLGIGARETNDGHVEIREIVNGGAAEAAGLRVGDILLAIGDRSTKDFGELGAALRDRRAGEKVAVRIRRGDEELTIEVTLKESL